MNETTILCTHCRSEFSEVEIQGATGCPTCGTRGIPADLTKKHTLTLTDHEWRIVSMWADRWAGAIKDDGGQAQSCVSGILREIKRQAPDLPALTLFAEIQDAANAIGTTITMIENGEQVAVEPEKKH